MVLLGTGAGLALPTATGSVVGSVPPTDSGVASAADTAAIQLGVAVVGSLLATRYQDRMTGAPSGRPFPATVKSSLGGALAAARAGGTNGPPLIHLAKTAFNSGMDLGLHDGAVVAVVGPHAGSPQCSTDPQRTGIRASGASLTAPRADAAIIASSSNPPRSRKVTEDPKSRAMLRRPAGISISPSSKTRWSRLPKDLEDERDLFAGRPPHEP
jgi:hypothetical protein